VHPQRADQTDGLSEFDAIRKSGIIAIGLDEGDILVDAKLSDRQGRSADRHKSRNVHSVRPRRRALMGRGAGGVRGIRLDKADQVVGMEVTTRDRTETLVTACELGFGKRTELSEYRDTSRGGKGVITIKTTDRNGPVIGIKLVTDTDDLMLMTEKGMAVRVHAKDLSVIGRNTQGYRLVRMEEGDKRDGRRASPNLFGALAMRDLRLLTCGGMRVAGTQLLHL
jgi:DNA gyrase subunit A